MRLPAPLSRNNPFVHKNDFGHVLIIAGSAQMIGAGALTALSAMRSGAGLVTLGVAKSLNLVAHKKISNVVMTLPLAETKNQTISIRAFKKIQDFSKRCDAVALGPGMSTDPLTRQCVLKIISKLSKPLVIDADGLNCLEGKLNILTKTNSLKILTPHPGEMARLLKVKRNFIESHRTKVALDFAKKYRCVLLLKGYKTVVASHNGETYVNQTGNAGVATAGSGDVLTGIIAAFIAQGLSSFEAARWGAYIHGRAGDLAAFNKTKISLIAADIIDHLPDAFKSLKVH